MRINVVSVDPVLYLQVGDGDPVGLDGGPARQARGRVRRRDVRVRQRRVDVAAV